MVRTVRSDDALFRKHGHPTDDDALSGRNDLYVIKTKEQPHNNSTAATTTTTHTVPTFDCQSGSTHTHQQQQPKQPTNQPTNQPTCFYFTVHTIPWVIITDTHHQQYHPCQLPPPPPPIIIIINHSWIRVKFSSVVYHGKHRKKVYDFILNNTVPWCRWK